MIKFKKDNGAEALAVVVYKDESDGKGPIAVVIVRCDSYMAAVSATDAHRDSWSLLRGDRPIDIRTYILPPEAAKLSAQEGEVVTSQLPEEYRAKVAKAGREAALRKETSKMLRVSTMAVVDKYELLPYDGTNDQYVMTAPDNHDWPRTVVRVAVEWLDDATGQWVRAEAE
jgi:hypothetical protein